jgi:hypothetical protein
MYIAFQKTDGKVVVSTNWSDQGVAIIPEMKDIKDFLNYYESSIEDWAFYEIPNDAPWTALIEQAYKQVKIGKATIGD